MYSQLTGNSMWVSNNSNAVVSFVVRELTTVSCSGHANAAGLRSERIRLHRILRANSPGRVIDDPVMCSSKRTSRQLTICAA